MLNFSKTCLPLGVLPLLGNRYSIVRHKRLVYDYALRQELLSQQLLGAQCCKCALEGIALTKGIKVSEVCGRV